MVVRPYLVYNGDFCTPKSVSFLIEDTSKISLQGGPSNTEREREREGGEGEGGG